MTMEQKTPQANQFTGDPRQDKMWEYYIQGIMRGQKNAFQAAILAGYSKSYANVITMLGWFKDREVKLRRAGFLSRAEEVLDEALELETHRPDGTRDINSLRIKADVAKYVTSTLGKEFYSKRTELTGKNGEPVIPILGDLKVPDGSSNVIKDQS